MVNTLVCNKTKSVSCNWKRTTENLHDKEDKYVWRIVRVGINWVNIFQAQPKAPAQTCLGNLFPKFSIHPTGHPPIRTRRLRHVKSESLGQLTDILSLNFDQFSHFPSQISRSKVPARYSSAPACLSFFYPVYIETWYLCCKILRSVGYFGENSIHAYILKC